MVGLGPRQVQILLFFELVNSFFQYLILLLKIGAPDRVLPKLIAFMIFLKQIKCSPLLLGK